MIGEININSHFWKGLRITFQGQNLLAATFIVRSSDYWTHASTSGMWPTKNQHGNQMLTLGTRKWLCWAGSAGS